MRHVAIDGPLTMKCKLENRNRNGNITRGWWVVGGWCMSLPLPSPRSCHCDWLRGQKPSGSHVANTKPFFFRLFAWISGPLIRAHPLKKCLSSHKVCIFIMHSELKHCGTANRSKEWPQEPQKKSENFGGAAVKSGAATAEVSAAKKKKKKI